MTLNLNFLKFVDILNTVDLYFRFGKSPAHKFVVFKFMLNILSEIINFSQVVC